MFTRFPRFGRSATVFTSSRPCNHRFLSVLADLHRYVRDRGARVTFSRFPPFWPFPPVSAVWPPFSRRLGRATTVFPALRPISTVTYVTGVPGERLAARIGRSATVFARIGRFGHRFRPFRPRDHRFPTFRPCERRFRSVSVMCQSFPRLGRFPTLCPCDHHFSKCLANFNRSARDRGSRFTLTRFDRFPTLCPCGHHFPSVLANRNSRAGLRGHVPALGPLFAHVFFKFHVVCTNLTHEGKYSYLAFKLET